ncbi:T9SS type A sorting domain-containing protein, partial [candidate division GN15 bacterium]|nr:T9SS type A sorting domain-containing protein [candidate division GN15 bacterium]
TIEDVNNWGEQIFTHFVDRFDGWQIRIEGVTYVSHPKRPLAFDDVVYALLEQEDSYAASVRRNMLAVMLNIVSNRLSQLEVISQDGATVSQALSYFAESYKDNQYCEDMDQRSALVEAHLNLRRILMGDMVPAGIIPPSTPTILFKQEGGDLEIPDQIVLHQNYPNPFNPGTEISFSLPEASDVTLEVYNVLGRRVESLIDDRLESGRHSVSWDASSAASGVYLYRLTAGDRTETRKMMLLK